MARPRFVRRSVGRQSTPKLFDFSPIERRSSLDRLQVAPISKRERWLIDYKFAVPLFRFLELFLSTSIERRDGPAFRAGSEFDGRFDVHRPRSSGRSARPSYRSFLIDGRSRPIEVGRGRSRPIEADRGRSRPVEANRFQDAPISEVRRPADRRYRSEIRFFDVLSIDFDRAPRSIGLSRSRLVWRSIQHRDRPVFSSSRLGRRSVGGQPTAELGEFSQARPERSPSEARSRPDRLEVLPISEHQRRATDCDPAIRSPFL